MLRYRKGIQPVELTALQSTPGSTWGSVGHDIKAAVRQALVRDQGALCAYCERRITGEDDERGRPRMKVEHWRAQSSSAEGLRWRNLLGVCLGGTNVPRGELHCDSSRGNAPLFLHPVEGEGPDPIDHLSYTAGGEVRARTGHPDVDRDLRALNLNAAVLRRGRQAVYDELRARLERDGFTVAALRRAAQASRAGSGPPRPEFAEFVSYHVQRWLRKRGAA